MTEQDIPSTPPEIDEEALEVTLGMTPELPTMSLDRYNSAYDKFMRWRSDRKITSFSENVLLVYFEHSSKSYLSSTLWSQFSMIKSTLNAKHNVDITPYTRLRAFLKRIAKNYTPKKSNTLNSEDFKKFLSEADDEKYLLTKV